MRRFFPLLLLVVILGSACSKPRIDASSGEKLKESLQKVRTSLPEKRRAVFDAAIATIYESQISFDTLMKGFSGIASVGANIQHALDGKTADEVIAYADLVRKEHPKSAIQEAFEKRFASALSPPVVTADDLKASILEMTKAGAGTDVIVRYVRARRLAAPLTSEQIVDWKTAGISDQVLAAVLTPPT